MTWKLNDDEAAELEARVLVELGNTVIEIQRERPKIEPRHLLQVLMSRGYTVAELRAYERLAARHGI